MVAAGDARTWEQALVLGGEPHGWLFGYQGGNRPR